MKTDKENDGIRDEYAMNGSRERMNQSGKEGIGRSVHHHTSAYVSWIHQLTYADVC